MVRVCSIICIGFVCVNKTRTVAADLWPILYNNKCYIKFINNTQNSNKSTLVDSPCARHVGDVYNYICGYAIVKFELY